MGIENKQLIELISENIVNNRLEEALELISEGENRLSEISEFWNLKAIVCIKACEYDIALACLEKALSKDKNNIDYLYNLAYVYEEVNDSFEAYSTYEKLEDLVQDKNEKEELVKKMNDISFINEQIIEKNTDDKVQAEFGDSVYSARKNVVEAIIDKDGPLVSVCILAYNNLEKYTKKCVECVLKYTKNINYELVLVDNGSSDGTLEYFKSINHPNKKIIKVTKNIGAGYGGYQINLNSAGKYIVHVPNDLFVTKDWLSNMLTCAMSDERIGMVVPASDYVSNYQSVELGYSDFDDMQKKAAEFNKSDARMWEERIRLIALGTLFKKECLDVIGCIDYGFFHDFGDDDITFRVRRAGYKAIFCKDTFVCHAGKITDKGKEFSENSIKFGREIFKEKYHGIDAWDDVLYEEKIIELVKINNDFSNKNPKILGIDTRCGQGILGVKNKLKQNNVFNTIDSAFSTDARFFTDLNTICQDVHVDKIESISGYFKDNYFDYIVIGKCINEYNDPFKVIKNSIDLLRNDGQLLLKVKNTYEIISLLKILGIDVNRKLPTAKSIHFEDVIQYVEECGCLVENVLAELFDGADGIKDIVFKLVKFETEEAKNHAFVNEYVFSIVKGNKE